MGLAEMRLIAELIDTVLASPADATVAATVRERVRALAREFPLYPVPNPGSS
jgi:glycine/serine hydroxymethyltransferase